MSEWISHPSYNSSRIDYDYAIIHLSEPVSFSGAVQTVCLPSTSGQFDNVTAVVTGWGTLKSGRYIDKYLLNDCLYVS